MMQALMNALPGDCKGSVIDFGHYPALARQIGSLAPSTPVSVTHPAYLGVAGSYVCDISKDDYFTGRYDVVLCVNLLGVLDDASVRDAFYVLWDAVKPGKYLILGTELGGLYDVLSLAGPFGGKAWYVVETVTDSESGTEYHILKKVGGPVDVRMSAHTPKKGYRCAV